MKPDDIQRFFEHRLKLAVPGAKLKSLKLTPENLLDMSAPMHAELEFSAEGMTADGQGKAIVTVPWIGTGLGVVNFILRDTGLKKRKYPMQTSTSCGLQEEVSLKLGDGFGGAVSLPECPPVEDEGFSLKKTFACTNQTLVCTRR